MEQSVSNVENLIQNGEYDFGELYSYDKLTSKPTTIRSSVWTHSRKRVDGWDMTSRRAASPQGFGSWSELCFNISRRSTIRTEFILTLSTLEPRS